MDNPFLCQSLDLPWADMTPERVQPDITRALENARAAVQTLAAKADAPALSFSDSFGAFEDALQNLGTAWGFVSHLQSVNDSPELREAYNAMLPTVTAFMTEVYLNSALYDTLAKAAENKAEWSAAESRYADETLADFKDAGAALPADKKTRLAEIDRDLAAKTQKFSENTLDATNAYTLDITDEARLAGLPEMAKVAARETAQKADLGTNEAPVYRFTLKMPSFIPVMRFADDDALRQAIYEASMAVGAEEPHANDALIKDILALRHEKAQLLGKKNFADSVLARRMAENGDAALAFSVELGDKSRPFSEQESADLEAFKAEKTGQPVGPLHSWDRMYWAEKLRQERYAFDSEALRPYFPLPQVQAGMFGIIEELMGVKITKRDQPGWHEEVECFAIHDADSGDLCGIFFTDWFPRDSKQGGAWMNSLIAGTDSTPHIGLMCGNMTPPSGGKPALLDHNDVLTLFHEFGHLIHGLLGRAPLRGLTGMNVAWDFIELPSQILENWCWEREGLDRFAQHYETGEKLPDDLLEKLQASRFFMEATAQMRQLAFGVFDLELHVNYDRWKDVALDEAAKEILPPYLSRTKEWPGHIMRKFGHIFGDPVGYAGGYYSYKWAEVLEADAFSRFKTEGILNPETGRAYRQSILAPGNTQPAAQLFRNFMGRDPNPDALLKRQGLTA